MGYGTLRRPQKLKKKPQSGKQHEEATKNESVTHAGKQGDKLTGQTASCDERFEKKVKTKDTEKKEVLCEKKKTYLRNGPEQAT